ncbi:MAG: UDP-glucose/GDP-mannose dehydrogenase family protein [Candidatus Neomarinimicrobiota bacterium]|nr:MAG: UDP-glucose/GDP-mannose dehydrogenase family protein [Candidatus Neomarinimicrobiota bacterium]
MKRVAVVGTGYVGLVSGAGISDFGHQVICADIDTDKIERLLQGEIPIYEPGLKEIVDRNVAAGRLLFTHDVPAAIRQSEVIFIAVGTPQGDNGDADLTAVFAVAETIGKNLNGVKTICTKSTVPIGTGKKICTILEKFNADHHPFYYVSNPEFLREGSAVKDFMHPDRVVVGASAPEAYAVLRDVYRPLYINETPLVETNVETAETIKYASNAFLALKISYINEMANLCETVGADVHVVAKTMGSDGRISPKFLHPGPGFGGSCFPKDTRALLGIARAHGLPFRTIEAAVEANEGQKQRMAAKLEQLVGDTLQGKTIGILGLAFKPQTDDVRESAAIPMIRFLERKGATIRAYDPVANESMRCHFPQVIYCERWEDAVRDTDAVVILTDWNEFRGMDLQKMRQLVRHPRLLDTRNILSMKELAALGFAYDNVGRGIRP